MSTFASSQGLFSQEHFTIVEIDLPVVLLSESDPDYNKTGFGTGPTSELQYNEIKTYSFTNYAGVLPVSGVYKVIKGISETTSSLVSGRGLGSRGTARITLTDFEKDDPNPWAFNVDEQVISQGSYFGKMDARFIMSNREMRIKNYRVEADGTIDLVNGAEIRHYITEKFSPTGKGEWYLDAKDELSVIDVNESVWPIPLNGFLRQDVIASELSWPVDSEVNYLVGDTVRCGEEFFKVSAISDIGTGTAEITTTLRGQEITYTNTLTRSVKSSHSAGDEVFVCVVSDDERLDDLLERILLDVGVEQQFIPKSDWAEEIDEWHPNTRINTLWYESQDTSEVLEKILTDYQIDMWFDPVARQIKISAISVWKESSKTITEGVEIDFESVKRTNLEQMRATRAYVVYDKPFLATSDSVENFTKGSVFKRTELETIDLQSKPKVKRFDRSQLLSKDAADLLVNRYVNRYSNPFGYSGSTQEKHRTFNTGDIVDIVSSITQGPDGLPSSAKRGIITSMNPIYDSMGRYYKWKADEYEPSFNEGTEIIIQGSVSEVNLYIQYAGAPSQPVDLTFIFDGTSSGSTLATVPSIVAGAFPAGSKLTLILVAGADLQAKGGDGGKGGDLFVKISTPEVFTTTPPENGKDGGTVIDAQGVDMDIYLSGPTPSVNYPVADGYIKAPSGGSGGFDAVPVAQSAGDGGDGGNGRFKGLGGIGGEGTGLAEDGSNGDDGSESALFSDLGKDGANNNAIGGAKGKGIVDNGATVQIFGETPSRYVNGGGDH